MTLLPVVLRELRASSKRPGTYWFRTGAASLLFLVAIWVFALGEHQRPQDLGDMAFTFTSSAAGLLCLFSGIRYTCDSISQEKRQGTLGLLFLTDLTGMDVVAGKLAANSVHALHGVMAMIPVLAIPLLLGGVSGAQLALVSLAILNGLFFSLAVGMLASSVHMEAKRASMLAMMLLYGISLLIPATGALLVATQRIPEKFVWPFLVPSPMCAFVTGFDRVPLKAAYWVSLALVHVMAWMALGAACVITRRTWQDKPAGARLWQWRQRIRQTLSGSPETRRHVRGRMLNAGPYYWLSARHFSKQVGLWMVFIAIAAVWLVFFWKYKRDWLNEVVYVFTAVILSSIIKVVSIGESGRQIAEDRQSGTLELILTAPTQVRELLEGQGLALRKLLAWPTLFVVVALMLFMALTFRNSQDAGDRSAWVLFWLALSIMLIVDSWAAYWCGMADGLRHGNVQKASSSTFIKVLVLPWVGVGTVMVSVGLDNISGSPITLMLLWVVAGLAVDLTVVVKSRKLLLERFRQIAAQPLGSTPGFWRRFFSK